LSEKVFEQYIPWVHDALLPGESTYALLNKLGWFAGRGPLQLMRDLRITEKNLYPGKPERIDYANVVDEWSSEAYRHLWPILRGRLKDYFDKSRFMTLNDYVPAAWEDEHLRFCKECIALGMHFTVCQLKFIEFCPYHQRRLISHCLDCGEQLDYNAALLRPAFCCNACGSSLLAADMSDICANQRIRRAIAHAHRDLIAAMDASAPITSMVTSWIGMQGRFPGVKEAMTEMLEPQRQRCEDLSLVPRYAAINIAINQHGLPSIQPISIPPRSDEPFLINGENQHAIHKSAQSRLGAWLLQRYSDHLVCIATSREVIKRKGVSQFSSRIASELCCIGNGFAVWEKGRNDRVYEKLPYKFWDAWGLKSTAERSFGSYILEKACLTGAIATFLRSDQQELTGWQASKWSTTFQNWEPIRKQGAKPAILWHDLSDIDFSEVCEASDLNEAARWQWASAHCAERHEAPDNSALGRIRVEHEAKYLKMDYGARERAATAMPILHARINEANGCPRHRGNR